jgi:membrane fusion protein, multidrug efflux system
LFHRIVMPYLVMHPRIAVFYTARHRAKAVIAPLVGLVMVGLLGACSKPAPSVEPVRAVRIVTVGALPLAASRDYAGEVRARSESRLGFRVGGKVLQRPVEVGQRVRPGQLLATLDGRDLQLASDAALAQVVGAQSQRDLAQADLKRFVSLKDQGFISSAEIERREATLRAAQAQLDQAQAQARVQGNQAGYARLLADAAGVVVGVDAEPGQVVGSGVSIVRVAVDGPRDVVFAVPEDKLSTVRPGLVMGVHTWSGTQRLSGRVREIAPLADPVTRTYSVRLQLDAAPALALGSTVTVIGGASSAAPSLIKLPTTALRHEGAGSAVWVLDRATMTVRSQPVVVATTDGNEAVVASGLNAGQEVVVAGVHVLTGGQTVSIYQEKSPLAQSAKALGATNFDTPGAGDRSATAAQTAVPASAAASR